MCVCVYVRKTPESGSLVVLSTQPYRLLLNKYGLSMSTHTQGYFVYMYVYQHSLMTTCRPASVLILIYAFFSHYILIDLMETITIKQVIKYTYFNWFMQPLYKVEGYF